RRGCRKKERKRERERNIFVLTLFLHSSLLFSCVCVRVCFSVCVWSCVCVCVYVLKCAQNGGGVASGGVGLRSEVHLNSLMMMMMSGKSSVRLSECVWGSGCVWLFRRAHELRCI